MSKIYLPNPAHNVKVFVKFSDLALRYGVEGTFSNLELFHCV